MLLFFLIYMTTSILVPACIIKAAKIVTKVKIVLYMLCPLSALLAPIIFHFLFGETTRKFGGEGNLIIVPFLWFTGMVISLISSVFLNFYIAKNQELGLEGGSEVVEILKNDEVVLNEQNGPK